MINPMVGGSGQAGLKDAAKSKLDKPEQQASEQDVNQFKQALNQPGKPVQNENIKIQPEQKTESEGDKILNKLSQLSDKFNNEDKDVMKDISGPKLSDADLLKAQLQLSKMTLEKTETSEVTNKTTKGIETLFRGQ